MKLRRNLITTLLLTIGLILHYITPGIFAGMKFDFLLIFIFISVFINDSKENIILTSILGGILSAMTTTFPGGQIPNIIDKLILGLILFLLSKILKGKLNLLSIALIGLFGTIISGTVFLTTAMYMTGIDLNIFTMIKTVVLPTSIINMVGTIFIYKIVEKSLKFSKVKI